jgi:multiple sugar transport system substrate-binding protein
MKISRRRLLRLTGTATISLFAAACASSPPPAAPVAPAAATSPPAAAPPAGAPAVTAPAKAAAGDPRAQWEAELPKGEVTVNFWHGQDSTVIKLYTETFIPGYKALHPNYTIKNEAVPGIDQKLVVALATDTAPDMFETNPGTIQAFMAKNALAPVPPTAWGAATIDEMLQKHFLPNSMRVAMKDGSLYGIPNQTNGQSLMMNIRLFKEAGLDPVKDAPKTWEDVATLSQKLTKREGGRLVQKGFEFLWARPDQISNSLLELIRQAGGEVLQDGVKPVFNTEFGVKAMQVLKSVTVDPKVTQTSPTSPVQDFAMEQNAMFRFGPNGGKFTESVNPNMKGNYVFGRLPQINPDKPFANLTSYNMTVNAKVPEDRQKVAHDFIRYMAMQPELWLAAADHVTPMVALRDSATAKQSMPFLDVAIADLLVAELPVRTEFAAQLETAMKAAIERVVFENQDPKASLDQAAEEFTKASSR